MASFTEQKKNLKIHMEAQETVDIKPSMSKKKKIWKYHHIGF